MNQNIKVLAIIGATASGKSDLAMNYARIFNGCIISCDSVQIYKYANIGSAKPSFKEQAEIPHYLVDLLEPTEQCNAGMWKDCAIQAVCDVHNQGKLPIIVGGTGLYLKSLYCGMFDQESRDQDYRDLLNQRAIEEGIETLYQELQVKDPVYAEKITPTDKLRIIRALEAIYVTKIPFSELHKNNQKPNWQWIFTSPQLEREELYQRIEARVYHMIELGLIEETMKLLEQFGRDISIFNAIGYKHVLRYCEQIYTKEQMIHQLIQDTRRFAKRQLTLFRSLLKDQAVIYSEKELKEKIL